MITESFPVDRERLEAALTAAERPMVLTGAAQLARAEKAWRRAPLLAVDTEFVRERTYYADRSGQKLGPQHRSPRPEHRICRRSVSDPTLPLR